MTGGSNGIGRETAEVAEAIAFLTSRAASGVNGIIMFVDGGTDTLLNTDIFFECDP